MAKILAIDDHTDNLISLKAVIGDAFPGAYLLTALNGPQGIEMAIANDPDVILLDVLMPSMDGFEVCRRLKQDDRVSDIPVVFLTAEKGEKRIRIDALEVGAEAFLSKPFEEPELIAQIKAMIKIKTANRQKRGENERLATLVAERTRELEQSHKEMQNLLDELNAEIESRKEIEQELRESEEKFRNIFEYHTAVKFIIDPETGSIINANIAAEKYYGWSKEQLLNMKIYDINILSVSNTKNAIELARNGGQHSFEFEHRLADGTIRDVEVFTSKIEVKGKYLLQSIVHDITERNQAKLATAISEARLKRAEIASRCGNWEFYLDSQKMIASEGAVKLYGVDKDVFDYAVIKKIPLAEYRPKLDEALRKLIEEDQPYDIEFKIKTVDTGEIKDIHSVATYDKDQRILFGIIQDITDRKLAEESLIKSENRLRELIATKDKFFNIIAHDLRGPFNSILGLSNMLVEQARDNDYEGMGEYAEIIQNSSQHAMNLLKNLLEWARSQTGRIEFFPEYVEAISLVNEAIALLNDMAHQKAIVISANIPRNALVRADKAMIGTILRNLITNAIKFSHPGGEIVITAEKKKHELVISVEDNGVGISKRSIGKLFRLDETYSATGTRNESGTGLGLILCKEFIEKHGGRIWVESEAGKGSKFSFSIPRT